MYRIIINSKSGIKRKKGEKEIAEKRMHSDFFNHFLIPFYAGIAGFASFLFIVMILEFVIYLIGISDTLKIGITEIMIAALGFVLQFIYEMLHQKQNNP